MTDDQIITRLLLMSELLGHGSFEVDDELDTRCTVCGDYVYIHDVKYDEVEGFVASYAALYPCTGLEGGSPHNSEWVKRGRKVYEELRAQEVRDA